LAGVSGAAAVVAVVVSPRHTRRLSYRHHRTSPSGACICMHTHLERLMQS
jgi:hypothetical protein